MPARANPACSDNPNDRVDWLVCAALLANGYSVRIGELVPAGWHATGERRYVEVTSSMLAAARRLADELEREHAASSAAPARSFPQTA
jgi:hypothetical protein